MSKKITDQWTDKEIHAEMRLLITKIFLRQQNT